MTVSHKPKEDNTPQVRRVTLLGMCVNILLTVSKFVAGILGNSRALVADAIHSLSDLSTDFAILVGSRYWNRPPDEDHPYGHRRIETLVSIAIGLVLASVGVFLALEAIDALREQKSSSPAPIAAAMALFSIIAKECLYRYTLNVGKRIKSSATIANAWHHRSDAVSSIPVLIAISVSYFFPNLFFLDSVGAILVSLFILQAAFHIAKPGIFEIIDKGASREIENKLRSIVHSVQEVRNVHELRTRYSGGALHVDLHIVLSPKITLQEAHSIGDRVRDLFLDSDLDIHEVLIHLDPRDDSQEDAEIAGKVDVSLN
ncbi:MAG: cation diffusion facilitator family transporter [Fibromonadaceae bacterium]|jgi:cation diffusion facilitator family transporter|nr:cation diffusion facilitator family transporter [Fibromonadaceae bacterium]